MTVSTEVSREEYTGNGVTTDFDYRFRVFEAADLVVSVADTTETISVLTLNTDYTVTGAGSRTGGKVKLLSPLAFNWRISVERALPVTQETDIRNQGNFFPEVHEDAFDKLTMLIQQVWSYFGLALRKPTWLAKYYDAQGNRIANLGNPINPQDAATRSYVDSTNDSWFKRTLRVPESYIPPISGVAGRKNKILAFDNGGNPLPVLPESGSASDVMIELAKPDGLKNIGRCPDIATLRTIEPARGSQLIDVVEYIAGGKVGGGEFIYDATDTVTPDDSGVTIVTANGARWKRAEYTKRHVKPEWWGGIANGLDCLVAMQSALNLATLSGGDLDLGEGKYFCDGDLIKPRVSTCPNIRGVGIGRNDTGIRTTIQFSEGHSLKILGLPGNLLGAELENFVLRGSNQEVDIPLIISCSCNINMTNLAFENCHVGASLRNDASGGFTEFCRFTSCVFRYNCHQAINYEVDGGRDSFRESGLWNCVIENWNPETGYHVRIGSGALVYNAPMDFAANVGESVVAVIQHNGDHRSTVYGDIRIEKNSSNSVELVTNKLYFVGNLLAFTPAVKTTNAIYCYRVTVNSDSTINRDRRPYSFSRNISSGEIVESFESGESALVEVTCSYINYEFKYLLSVSMNRTDSSGSVTIVSTMRSLNNSSDWGAPVFSFSAGNLIVTNPKWSAGAILLQVFVNFTGTRAYARFS